MLAARSPGRWSCRSRPIITTINRVAIITTINRVAIFTAINRIAIFTAINRIAIITAINRIAIITAINRIAIITAREVPAAGRADRGLRVGRGAPLLCYVFLVSPLVRASNVRGLLTKFA